MPAEKRITKEAIVDAALDVLREGGYSSVNARSVAKKLGCSTQPIYLSFRNMDELKAALTERAILEHKRRVLAAISENKGVYSRYCNYGVGFVRFAENEKQLFRWLYLGDGQAGPRRDDVLLPQIIQTIVDEYGYSLEIAEKIHKDMTFYSYGLAILANTGNVVLGDTELFETFRREFFALTLIYGKPPKKKLNYEII